MLDIKELRAMKNRKRILFLFAGGFLAMAITSMVIFFLLNWFDVVDMRFNSKTFDVINTVPLAVVYIYGIVSAFYKTGSFKQTLIVGIVGVLVHLNALLFIIPPLGFLICGGMAIVGIIMYLYSFRYMEKWTPMSFMLMSCVCYELTFCELANGGGAGFSFWETFLLPVICILIIVDLIATVKFSKQDLKVKA